MASKKKTKKQEKLIQEIAQNLTNILHKNEVEMKYKKAIIINNDPIIEQPIILSSDENFEKHYMNLCNGMSIGFPSKAIPYMIKALTELYMANALDHFKGDQKAVDAFMAKLASYSDNSELIDLSTFAPETDSVSAKGSNPVSELKRVFVDNMDTLSELPTEDVLEIKDKVEEMQALVDDQKEKMGMGLMTPAQMKELKAETDKKLMEHIKEVELKLVGKVEEKEKKIIDFEYIKSVFEKHGEIAAMEELMRVPPEERDDILSKAMDIFRKG